MGAVIGHSSCSWSRTGQLSHLTLQQNSFSQGSAILRQMFDSK